MPTHGAPRRDFRALEDRRQQAALWFAAGRERQGTIARRLGVSRQGVRRWFQAWRNGGRRALRAAGRAGRRPRPNPAQLAAVERTLRQGPSAFGFLTTRWTLPRVATVIQPLTGVQDHPGHLWRTLGALDWTRQPPAQRATERNEPAIPHGTTNALTRGRKNARRRAWIVVQD
jgi:transposase